MTIKLKKHDKKNEKHDKKNNSMDSPILPLTPFMNDWSYGQLLLLVSECRDLILVLERKVSLSFREDLDFLAQPFHTPQQKIIFIRVMFDQYASILTQK